MIPRRLILYIVGAFVVILVLMWLVNSLLGGKRAAVEAKLGKNTTEAAIASGRDAVGAVSQSSATKDASEALTRSNDRDIRDAEGSDSAVAKPANDAGIAALCRRAAYRDSDRCKRLRGESAGN